MRWFGAGLRAIGVALLLLPLPGLASAVWIDVDAEWRELPSSTREYAFYGGASLADAEVEVEGSRATAKSFVGLFPLPPKA